MVGRGEFMDVHEAWVKGKSISEIARLTGRDRKTIRRLLREGGPKPRAQREVGSKLDPYRQYLLGRMLGEDPVSNAEVLFDEIREMGYEGGRSILKEFLHPFRELAEEKTTVRFETPPGKQAQVDWGTFQKPGRKRLQGFVMTLGWSRTMYLDFSATQALASFLGCHEEAFHYFEGVPEEILYDRTRESVSVLEQLNRFGNCGCPRPSGHLPLQAKAIHPGCSHHPTSRDVARM
jgi:transposase